MGQTILKLENFSKSYGDKEVIKHIDLEVKQGEFLTILGSSGCGKTTILRCISGLEYPSNGNIFIDNVDVTLLDPTKRPVNTLFQNYALFPFMSVKENIEFGLKMKKLPESTRTARVKEMLKLVKLEGYENRKPSELSGGEQQRVSIARGLANKPKILLLDEPLSALDMKLRKQTQIELKNLQKQLGITFILVTHDQNIALTMSDRILLLHNGLIAQLDTPYNIYRYPKNDWVADFIGESNIFTIKIFKSELNCSYASLDVDEIKINKMYNKDEKKKIVIRPEDFKILNRKSKYNSLKCTVIDLIYDGAITKIHLDYNNKIIKMNIPSTQNNLKIGQKINIGWNIEDAYVIGAGNE